MPRLAAAVGSGQVNYRSDVRTVQALLNRCQAFVHPPAILVLDGLWGPATERAIRTFQSDVVRLPSADGIVLPHGPTLLALSQRAAPIPLPVARPTPKIPPPSPAAPAHPSEGAGASKPADANGAAGGLTEAEYVDAAKRLHCEAAAVKAVVLTEVAIRGPFDAEGRPTILFERHFFHRLSGGRFDSSNPDISNPVQGGYGRFAEQYPKLDRAIKLDRQAALRSASWGAFQIMGDNFRAAGFNNVEDFVTAMKASVQSQVNAFVNFVMNNTPILQALQAKDWTNFAKHYNGPAYAKNHYDSQMRLNYERAAKVA